MVVLDSSFLVAYHNQTDVHHAAAREVMVRLIGGELGPGLLPEYVFLEVVTVLAARRDLETAVEVGELLLSAREIELVPCSELFLRSFDVFRGQEAFRPSFTDAAIVTVVRERGAEAVVTFDADFRHVTDLRVIPS